MLKTYTRRYKCGKLTIQCDLTQATAPIRMTWDGPEDDGRYVTIPTPFRTANARHDLNEAFKLCKNYEY